MGDFSACGSVVAQYCPYPVVIDGCGCLTLAKDLFSVLLHFQKADMRLEKDNEVWGVCMSRVNGTEGKVRLVLTSNVHISSKVSLKVKWMEIPCAPEPQGVRRVT